MSLPDAISQALGVVAVPVPFSAAARWARHQSWAPARPEPIYEYDITVTRREYGHAVVRCAEDDKPLDYLDDIDWYDSDGLDVQSIDRTSSTPVNQNEINAWDAEFGEFYDTDGQPMCTGCHHCVADATVLTKSGASWYCPACLSDYRPDVEP